MLKLVVTARAKSRIKQAIRDDRKSYKNKGTEKLKYFFEQANIEYTRYNVQQLQDGLDYPSSIDLYYFIASNKIGLKEIKLVFSESERNRWFRYFSLPFGRSRTSGTKSFSSRLRENIRTRPESLLLEGNISNLNYDISECCNPIPGDDVLGLISEDQSIRIHRANCPKAISNMTRYGNRIVKAKWRKDESISFLAGLKIIGIDNIGFISDIIAIISNELNLNIRSFHLETSEGVTNAVVMVYVSNLKSLKELIEKLKKVKSINKIMRMDRFSEAKKQT